MKVDVGPDALMFSHTKRKLELTVCNSYCREAWELLLDNIEARDQKLQGAGEIHRFNRDVEEALSRIQVLNYKNI